MIAYKLLRVRKDGSLGPLFINRRQHIPVGRWLLAGYYPTRGYRPRAGWHCTKKPVAPHLTTKGRVWYEVEVRDAECYKRPESQGGEWVLAHLMKLRRPVR